MTEKTKGRQPVPTPTNAKTKVQIIFDLIKEKPTTRRMIAVKMGTPNYINSVCFFVKSLLKDGLIIVSYKAPCKISGSKAEYLAIAKYRYPSLFTNKEMEGGRL
jgi:hypothetical protein